MRAPDGTWTVDPPDPAGIWADLVAGADDAAVYALAADDVRWRDTDGTWTALNAPVDSYELRGLHVFGPFDVLALKVVQEPCGDCLALETPVLLWWDGFGWTADVKPTMVVVEGMTVLPDRTVVLAANGGVGVIDPIVAPIPSPPGFFAASVVSAPDGTLVALGYDGTVAMGTVAGGLAQTDPGLAVDAWTSAWAASADDVWISGEREQGGLPRSSSWVTRAGSWWTARCGCRARSRSSRSTT